MEGIIKWALNNRVAPNLLMWMLIIGGVINIFNIKKEIFPELAPEIITITVPYPGASPEEVEESIILKIEEEVGDVVGIKETRSRAYEGLGLVTLELKTGVKAEEITSKVKTKIDSISTFPKDSEKPIVEALDILSRVIDINIWADTDSIQLKNIAESIKSDLLQIPGISQVKFTIDKDYELLIEVDESNLNRLGLTVPELAKTIRDYSQDIPAGTIETKDDITLVRALQKARTAEEFAKIPALTTQNNNIIKLGEIADITDYYSNDRRETKFNSVKSIGLSVFRVGEENAIGISNSVKEYVKKKSLTLPPEIKLSIWADQSIPLKERIALLTKNAISGIILVFVVLSFFLAPSLALWVTLGIPISFLGTMFLMPYFGISINLLSLFGFILVLGIVVDDAIIIGESIFSEMQSGIKDFKAAISGTTKVAVPVTFSVLTSITAFGAVMSSPGNVGTIFATIALVVILTLSFSLVESLLILPVHLAYDHIKKPINYLMLKFIGSESFKASLVLENISSNSYKSWANKFVSAKYLTLLTFIATFLITTTAAFTGFIKFSFFPDVKADDITAGIELPEGTSYKVTEAELQKLEAAAIKLKKDLKQKYGKDIILNIQYTLGEQPFAKDKKSKGSGPSASGGGTDHLGELNLEIISSEQREITLDEIEKQWRQNLTNLSPATILTMSSALFSTGPDLEIHIKGSDPTVLEQVSKQVMDEVSGYKGVYELLSSAETKKQEIQIELKPKALTYGLTAANVGRQIRGKIYGEEVQRLQKNNEDIKVMVRLLENQKNKIETALNTEIKLPNGNTAALEDVANISFGYGPNSIVRINGKKLITITAKVDETISNAQILRTQLEETYFPKIRQENLGLSISFEGSQKDQRELFSSLKLNMTIAMIIIYALMAIPFKSYTQPIIIMLAIPFGLIGAIIGHYLVGISVTIMSMFGMVALTGVVVNDGIVMVTRINELRGEMSILDAVIEGGVQRFRPVMLTSLTTFAGLIPIIAETSIQAQFLIPVAVSLGFGIIFATFITLVLVPVGYLILEDFKRLF